MRIRLDCKHCLYCAENSIGEKVAFCDIWGEWKNITLGDCYGNCESQESADDFCSYGERREGE